MLDYWVVFAFVVLFFLIPSLAIWWLYKDHVVVSAKQYKTFVPRFCANLVDAAALAPLGVILQLLLQRDASFWDTLLWLLVIVFVVNHIYYWCYSIYLHGAYGQTLGKMITRVKVVDVRTHGPISFRQAFLRDMIPLVILLPIISYGASQLSSGWAQNTSLMLGLESSQIKISTNGATWAFSILPLWWTIELITMLTNKRGRAFQDWVADTIVARTNIEATEEAV